MKKWQLVLGANLAIAVAVATFMFLFFEDATSRVFGPDTGRAIGGVAGLLTFLGGGRIALGTSKRVRDRLPMSISDGSKSDFRR
jgi:ascorbate-specific PTS system EIIC-type component UlaA